MEADGGSLPGLLREICLEPLPLASQRAAELRVDPNVLPHGFDAWFARCVDRNIDARFQEAGAATQAFQHLVGTGVAPERRLKLATMNFDNASAPMPQATAATAFFSPEFTSGGTPAGPGGTMAAVSAAATAPKPKPFPWLAAVGVAVVATGVGGFLAYKASGTNDAPSAALSTSGSAAATELPKEPSAGTASSAQPQREACPEGMLLHPKGTTFMGSRSLPEYAGANVDGLRVTLSAFCLDKTEVTVEAYEKSFEEWRELKRNNPSCPTLYVDHESKHVGPPFQTVLQPLKKRLGMN
jgi:cell wall-associated NlpC family hydrolase